MGGCDIYLLHQIDIHCIDVAIEQFFGFESCFFIIASFDFVRVNFIVKTTRIAPCEEKTKWSNMRIKDVYRSRLRQIEQPKPRINPTSSYAYRRS